MYLYAIRLVGLTNVDFPRAAALPTDKFILKGVDGIGPPEVDVSISDLPEQGGYYTGRRPRNRQIVMKVGLNPDWTTAETAADLRTTLYGLLTPGFADIVRVQMQFSNTGSYVETTGYISKMEINPWSKNPEVLITIDCLTPYFQAQADTATNVATMNKTDPQITNTGTAPTGLHLEFVITATGLVKWSFFNADSSKAFILQGNFTNGDKVLVNTTPGERSLTRKPTTDPTVEHNIIDMVTKESQWIQMHGGVNQFHVLMTLAGVASTAWTWTAVTTHGRYWGF